MTGISKLRHAGILVEDLERAQQTYMSMGFRPVGTVETLRVLKMADQTGQVIELVCGNWPGHIAVDWYDDGEGNLLEVVTPTGSADLEGDEYKNHS